MFIGKVFANHAAGDGMPSPWGKSLGFFIAHVKNTMRGYGEFSHLIMQDFS